MVYYDPLKPQKEEPTMKKLSLRRRAASAMLALILLLSAFPLAYAASYTCKMCDKDCKYTVLKEANCQEAGVVEYTCTNVDCDLVNKAILVKTDIDPTNHLTVCTDNGDGLTHNATCRVCTAYRDVKEEHTFENGYCTKCSAVDYAQAEISMYDALDIYVNLNDTEAVLSIGEIAMKVGNVDISDKYTFSFGWMDQYGNTVSNSETYLLPASITSKIGDYSYGCFVVAMPNGVTSGKFISKSCTVTVHVRELVIANAVVSSDGKDFTMGDTNSLTPVSVTEQIYQAAYNLSDAYPSYVVFDSLPTSSVGVLETLGGRYYFSPSSTQTGLNELVFDPSSNVTGTYTVIFTVYDSKGNDFPGVLTIHVEHDIGTIDVPYVTEKGTPITFHAEDFDAFWEKAYPTGSLTLINFTSLPTSRQGKLYFDYSLKTNTGTQVRVSDLFYSDPSNDSQYLIDTLTFVPDAKFTGHLTIPFDAYGLGSLGRHTTTSGSVSIFVSDGAVKDVTFTVEPEKTLTLNPADFMSVYQQAVSKTASNFTIKLLDVPTYGSLYVDYTGAVREVPLNASTVSGYSFQYSSLVTKEISDITYVAPKTTNAVTDSIRYIACDSKGEFQFVGEIVFSVKPTVKVYTKFFPDVLKTTATEWYYTAVMDLAEANVIGGYDDGTFKPDEKVTYGQALKLIMLAAGYPVPVQTGTHWASGYLAVAKADGLVNVALTESHLDRAIDRNTIAQIAAKAMKLPASTRIVSPFADVAVGSTYASYIFALYDAGIITGSTDSKTGATVYYGPNAIRRSEMSVIVWRINNYKKV